MAESHQPTDIQITNMPVDIPPSNTFYVSDPDELPNIAPTPVADAAHITVPGNLRDYYGPMVARRAYAREHQHPAGNAYHGRDNALLMFNVGHSTPLYHSGLIDESNIIQIVDKKKRQAAVYAVVPVGQLLEMAIWMVDHDISLPQVQSVQESSAHTWFGLIAEALIGELGQGSLHEKVKMIKRRMRPDILESKLQDRRRTPHSVIQEVVRAYHAKHARNKHLVPAARDFLTQLEDYHRKMPHVVDYNGDQDLIKELEARIKQMEQDLEDNPRPFPEETPPSPTI